MLLQVGLLLRGQVLRRYDDHGDLAQVGVLLQALDHAEPVHHRHQQIEKDGVRTRPGDFVERPLTVCCAARYKPLCFKQLRDHTHRIRIVIHDQDVPGAVGLQPLEHRQDRLAVRRLHQVVVHPQLIAQLLVIRHGDHHDRHVACLRIALEHPDRLPPVLVRHDDVHRDRNGAQPFDHRHPFVRAPGAHHAVSYFGQLFPEQEGHVRIVVDHHDGSLVLLALRDRFPSR